MGYEEIPLRANGQTVTADWFNAIRTYGIGSISTYTAFAGGGQGSATALTTDICRVTTCATNNDSVKLPVSANNKRVLVINETAQTLSVYPQTGEQIDALGTNNAISISAYGSITFIANTTLKWASITKIGSISNSDIASDAAIVYSKLNRSVVTKTTTATLTTAESGVILASSAGGAYTITLPTAVGNTGLWYEIIKTTSDLSLITIDGNASETINGSANYVLAFNTEAVKIASDGSNWRIASTNKPRVYAQLYGSTSSIATVTSTLFDITTVHKDPFGIVSNNGNGTATSFPDTNKLKITAPKSGNMVISMYIQWNITTADWEVGEGIDLSVYRNGSSDWTQSYDNQQATGNASSDFSFNFVPVVSTANAGDYFQPVVYQASDVTIALSQAFLYAEFLY